MRFDNRKQAGQLLAQALANYNLDSSCLVLALPRGGVPLGYEIAQALQLDLDVFIVRKLGFPGQPELAMGAIAEGGEIMLNQQILDLYPVSEELLQNVIVKEKQELKRRRIMYRVAKELPDLTNTTIIIVDDGVATGATMLTAIYALHHKGVKRIIAAIPVGSPDTIQKMSQEVDEMVCLITPNDFMSICQYYVDFEQLTDQQVSAYLA